MKEEFIELLRSTKREGIENLLNFLEKSDFYTAPASTRFHGNYEGGLLEHSMKVYEIFKEKIKASGLSTPEDTVIIAPLLHDICKTNYYKVDYRNAKNARGEWEKVPYYAVEDTIPYGHGEKICNDDYRIHETNKRRKIRNTLAHGLHRTKRTIRNNRRSLQKIPNSIIAKRSRLRSHILL